MPTKQEDEVVPKAGANARTHLKLPKSASLPVEFSTDQPLVLKNEPFLINQVVNIYNLKKFKLISIIKKNIMFIGLMFIIISRNQGRTS
jgi:hypothetical protein